MRRRPNKTPQKGSVASSALRTRRKSMNCSWGGRYGDPTQACDRRDRPDSGCSCHRRGSGRGGGYSRAPVRLNTGFLAIDITEVADGVTDTAAKGASNARASLRFSRQLSSAIERSAAGGELRSGRLRGIAPQGSRSLVDSITSAIPGLRRRRKTATIMRPPTPPKKERRRWSMRRARVKNDPVARADL